MKTRITLIALALATSLAAQNTFRLENYYGKESISQGNSLYVGVNASETHSIFVDVVNTSTAEQTYNVKRWDILLNSNSTETASALFCFGENCYTPGVMQGLSPVTLPAGSRTSNLPSQPGVPQMLVAELEETSETGLSVVMYKVFNTKDTTDAISFTMRYNDPSAGLASAAMLKTGLSLAPNPAQGATSAIVTLPVSARCNISIYDILGGQVSSTDKILPAGQSSVPLNIANLKQGVYFVNFTSGAASSVRRLVVN